MGKIMDVHVPGLFYLGLELTPAAASDVRLHSFFFATLVQGAIGVIGWRMTERGGGYLISFACPWNVAFYFQPFRLMSDNACRLRIYGLLALVMKVSLVTPLPMHFFKFFKLLCTLPMTCCFLFTLQEVVSRSQASTADEPEAAATLLTFETLTDQGTDSFTDPLTDDRHWLKHWLNHQLKHRLDQRPYRLHNWHCQCRLQHHHTQHQCPPLSPCWRKLPNLVIDLWEGEPIPTAAHPARKGKKIAALMHTSRLAWLLMKKCAT